MTRTPTPFDTRRDSRSRTTRQSARSTGSRWLPGPAAWLLAAGVLGGVCAAAEVLERLTGWSL